MVVQSECRVNRVINFHCESQMAVYSSASSDSIWVLHTQDQHQKHGNASHPWIHQRLQLHICWVLFQHKAYHKSQSISVVARKHMQQFHVLQALCPNTETSQNFLLPGGSGNGDRTAKVPQVISLIARQEKWPTTLWLRNVRLMKLFAA